MKACILFHYNICHNIWLFEMTVIQWNKNSAFLFFFFIMTNTKCSLAHCYRAFAKRSNMIFLNAKKILRYQNSSLVFICYTQILEYFILQLKSTIYNKLCCFLRKKLYSLLFTSYGTYLQ